MSRLLIAALLLLSLGESVAQGEPLPSRLQGGAGDPRHEWALCHIPPDLLLILRQFPGPDTVRDRLAFLGQERRRLEDRHALTLIGAEDVCRVRAQEQAWLALADCWYALMTWDDWTHPHGFGQIGYRDGWTYDACMIEPASAQARAEWLERSLARLREQHLGEVLFWSGRMP